MIRRTFKYSEMMIETPYKTFCVVAQIHTSGWMYSKMKAQNLKLFHKID